MDFQIGDKVIGNDKAVKYNITCPGWVGIVTHVEPTYIVVRELNSVGSGYDVDIDCFDLLERPIMPSETTLLSFLPA